MKREKEIINIVKMKKTAISRSRYEMRQIQLVAVNNARKDPEQEEPRKKTDFCGLTT